MSADSFDPYATLGLAPDCTDAEIRAAFRALAKLHHPDLHAGAAAAVARFRTIQEAYALLSDAKRRAVFDRERGIRPEPPARAGRSPALLRHEVRIAMAEFLSGTRLTIQVNDPSGPGAGESYVLEVPADSAPGTRLRIARAPAIGGMIEVRLKPRPDARFKVRGSDLCCDLRLRPQRVATGGMESLRGVHGRMVAVHIPRGVAPRAVLRVPNEGLPRPRGGHGDLLVRVMYRPEVRVTGRRAG